ADALGYHAVGPDGLPYGKVFCQPILDGGGEIFENPKRDGYAISVTASHEAVETFGDPSADEWVHNAAAPAGEEDAKELCDAVQAASYDVPTSLGMVSVSNFLMPAYFGL